MGGFFSVPPTSKPPAPVSVQETPEQAPALDEEEISDLIDVVLCADDITPDTREWAAEIHKFFEGGHKQTTKAKILKAYHGKLDTDYITETGEHLYLTAGEDGLTFEIEGQQFTEDYGKLTARIDRLILTGAYPFSSADTVIDDYAIPDEQEEMQSIADEDEDSPDEPPASAELSETDRQKIIDEYLQHGSGTQGGRQRIFQAMLSMPAKKDRVDFIRKEYYSYSSSRSQPGGDRWRLEYTPKGLVIDYRSGHLALHETLSWNQVESGISDLIRQERYLTEKDKTEMETEGQTVYLPAPEAPEQEASDRQLTLFDMTSAMPESYEDAAEDSNDGMIDGNSVEPMQLPFQEGDRIYYNDRVFEIVKFMHDGRTVEIGDIAQLKNLNRLKITERVPLSAIADCKSLKDHYTNGEIATMVVESVQSGDFSEETQAAIKAATLVNQSNDEYNRTIMDDFHARAWGEGFNYRYSPDHHLYDGGPKTKFKNNIAAIRLLKELQAQGRPATAEEQITLARFVGWGEHDAIIMGHSSFELIGLSRERQLAAMESEMAAITEAIAEVKARDGKDWTLKQMQIFKSNLQFRYDRLFNAEKKDSVINFEELGVDALFVDEAHAYKNNFSYTKMRNVAGVTGVSSQRAMDMHQKCQYINDLNNGKGVVYLTGTPISNTMAELYVLQKTLQPWELEKRGLPRTSARSKRYAAGRRASSVSSNAKCVSFPICKRSAFSTFPRLFPPTERLKASCKKSCRCPPLWAAFLLPAPASMTERVTTLHWTPAAALLLWTSGGAAAIGQTVTLSLWAIPA